MTRLAKLTRRADRLSAWSVKLISEHQQKEASYIDRAGLEETAKARLFQARRDYIADMIEEHEATRP